MRGGRAMLLEEWGRRNEVMDGNGVVLEGGDGMREGEEKNGMVGTAYLLGDEVSVEGQ